MYELLLIIVRVSFFKLYVLAVLTEDSLSSALFFHFPFLFLSISLSSAASQNSIAAHKTWITFKDMWVEKNH